MKTSKVVEAFVLLMIFPQCTLALTATVPRKVLVTGAGGRTGRLVLERLSKEYKGTFAPVALARSKKAQAAVKKQVPDAAIVSADVVGDDSESLAGAMKGVEAVVLCTSAVPAIKLWSIVKVLFKKTILRKNDGRPEFSFPDRGTPEEVDWLGAKAQIDAAVRAGVKHFIFISSMGGTQPENFLNTIGRRADGSGGDILLWKRKAERYLVDSGLTYTVIHPGGLVDEAPAKRELIVGVDDELLQLKSRSVARADVARVCCAALVDERARNTSFDLASKPVGEGTPTLHARDVFDTLSDDIGRSCDYSTVLPDPPSVFAASSTSTTAGKEL